MCAAPLSCGNHIGALSLGSDTFPKTTFERGVKCLSSQLITHRLVCSHRNKVAHRAGKDSCTVRRRYPGRGTPCLDTSSVLGKRTGDERFLRKYIARMKFLPVLGGKRQSKFNQCLREVCIKRAKGGEVVAGTTTRHGCRHGMLN